MRQAFSVSRRKVVTLVAGTLAASAGPVASGVTGRAPAAAAAPLKDADLFAGTHPRMLQLMASVRRTRGATSRAEAFRRFATALRLHAAADSFHATAPREGERARDGRLTALYRERKPDTVLANVILRELEAAAPNDPAWMTRFADLEAVIHGATFA